MPRRCEDLRRGEAAGRRAAAVAMPPAFRPGAGAALLDHAGRRLAALLQAVAAFDVDAWLKMETRPHA